MSRTNRGSHSKRAVLCMLVCVSGTVGTTLADGFRNPPEGAAVLGRGGVHLTEVNDLTAATHNPANLADLKVSSAMASATLAESDKHVLGIGAGYAKGDQRLDVAYAYNIQDDRQIDTPENPVNGTDEVDQHLLSIAYGRNF